MSRLSDAVESVAEAYSRGLEAAQNGLQTRPEPLWLERLDMWASNMVGVLFVWVRIISGLAVLMWSFFLFILPVLLATWIIVTIVATTAPLSGR